MLQLILIGVPQCDVDRLQAQINHFAEQLSYCGVSMEDAANAFTRLMSTSLSPSEDDLERLKESLDKFIKEEPYDFPKIKKHKNYPKIPIKQIKAKPANYHKSIKFHRKSFAQWTGKNFNKH